MYIQGFSHEESSTVNTDLSLGANCSWNARWLWESHCDFLSHFFHLHGEDTDFPLLPTQIGIGVLRMERKHSITCWEADDEERKKGGKRKRGDEISWILLTLISPQSSTSPF